MPDSEITVPKSKEPRSRSADPKSKHEREAVILSAEGANLLTGAQVIVDKVAAASSCTPRQLLLCLRRLDALEADFASLLPRVALHNAAAPPEVQVDLAPVHRQLSNLVLDFHFQHEDVASSSSAAGVASSSASPVRLPDMTLPAFSGHFRDWPRLRSVVEETLLSHPSASEAQRYAALSSALSGEPAQIIASAALLTSSFSSAWALLRQRYDRPRVVGYAFIDALLDCPAAASSQAPTLQALTSSVREFVQVLHAQPDLATEVRMESRFLARLLLRKLPGTLCQRFEEQSSSVQMPSLEEVLLFVDRFCSAAERVRPAASPKSSSPPAVTSSEPRRPRTPPSSSSAPASARLLTVQASSSPSPAQTPHLCAYCRDPHSIRQCREFKAMRCAERRAAVDRLHLCRNCLSALHKTADCSSEQRCHICQAHHHTILHLAAGAARPTSSAPRTTSTPAHPTATTPARPTVPTPVRPATPAPSHPATSASVRPPAPRCNAESIFANLRTSSGAVTSSSAALIATSSWPRLPAPATTAAPSPALAPPPASTSSSVSAPLSRAPLAPVSDQETASPAPSTSH